MQVVSREVKSRRQGKQVGKGDGEGGTTGAGVATVGAEACWAPLGTGVEVEELGSFLTSSGAAGAAPLKAQRSASCPSGLLSPGRVG